MECHNPYFNRWFSAIEWEYMGNKIKYEKSHNPYFNRWFSAIYNSNLIGITYKESQSLF